LHHDVHGPWALPGGSLESARRYWEQDDALFRSEVGAPGASGKDIIERYSGGIPTMPASADNPLWRRSSWWIEWDEFIAAREADAGEPTLSEFVDWSATRQADALELAARAVKRRFPRAGGFIVWMGHDCFPCTANTAVLDFNGRMKPAAHALARVFHTPSDEL
jgi:beta-mannosidase